MTGLETALLVCVLLFGSIAGFLFSELIKKFRFDTEYARTSSMLIRVPWPGAKRSPFKKPGMRNIVLNSKDGQPFVCQIGFWLHLPFLEPLIDYYGFVKSDETGRAIISTYKGNGVSEFALLIGSGLNDIIVTPADITTSMTEADQELEPDVIYPPHWWQRLGICS